MPSTKSIYEINMQDLLKKGEEIIDDSYMKTKEARKILDTGYQILQMCGELRKSKNKWEERALTAEKKLKEVKK